MTHPPFSVNPKMIEALIPGIATMGEGFVDWHIPPNQYCPAGRYRITKIWKLPWSDVKPGTTMFDLEYVGPISRMGREQ